MPQRSEQRTEYLQDVVDIAAMCHATCAEDGVDADRIADGVGYTILDSGIVDGAKVFPVTIETAAAGLAAIRAALPTEDNKTTIPYLSATARRTILEGDRTNGDTGAGWDDAGLCAAVIEIGLWGQVVYA